MKEKISKYIEMQKLEEVDVEMKYKSISCLIIISLLVSALCITDAIMKLY